MREGIIREEINKSISMLDRYAQFTKNDVELHFKLLQENLIEEIKKVEIEDRAHLQIINGKAYFLRFVKITDLLGDNDG